VCQVPTGKRPSDLKFALDIRKGDVNGYTHSTNIRFDWRL